MGATEPRVTQNDCKKTFEAIYTLTVQTHAHSWHCVLDTVLHMNIEVWTRNKKVNKQNRLPLTGCTDRGSPWRLLAHHRGVWTRCREDLLLDVCQPVLSGTLIFFQGRPASQLSLAPGFHTWFMRRLLLSMWSTVGQVRKWIGKKGSRFYLSETPRRCWATACF